MRLFRWLRKSTCNHEFSISDITLTGIKEPETPDKSDYKAWKLYHSKFYDHDFIVKRVWCLCKKCNTGHYATCGLNLRGKLVR